MADRQMTRGDTFVFTVQVESPAPSIPIAPTDVLVPQDITGWTMWFTAKYNYADPDSLAVAQVSSTGISTPPGGSIVFTVPKSGIAQIIGIPPSATLGFPDSPVTLVYDVQAKDLLGNCFTVDSGTVTVSPDVTRVFF